MKPVSRDDLLGALAGAGVTDGGGDVTPGRVLVVEDNERNRKLVRTVLEHAGYDVVEAATGEQGVTTAAEVEPDLVLMDVQLPGHRRARGAAPAAATRSARGTCRWSR